MSLTHSLSSSLYSPNKRGRGKCPMRNSVEYRSREMPPEGGAWRAPVLAGACRERADCGAAPLRPRIPFLPPLLLAQREEGGVRASLRTSQLLQVAGGLPGKSKNLLDRRLTTCFWKKPNSKYFRLRGPYRLS